MVTYAVIVPLEVVCSELFQHIQILMVLWMPF